MCGILCALTPYTAHATPLDSVLDSLRACAAQRGPNASGTYTRLIARPSGSTSTSTVDPALRLTLAASVLGLRGALTPQPVVSARGVLAFNGQAYTGVDTARHRANDTRAIFARLEAGDDVERVFGDMEGPYAFAYYDKRRGTLSFGVDPLSRRSLLLHVSSAGLVVASARSGECRRAGLGMRALDGGEFAVLRLSDVRAGVVSAPLEQAITSALDIRKLDSRYALQRISPAAAPFDTSEAAHFLYKLETSVRRRVEEVPAVPDGQARLAVLFSGGVDCTLLAALVHRCLDPAEPIELINVAFSSTANYDTPDRQSAMCALAELEAACPRAWRFVAVDVSAVLALAHRQAVVDLMYPCTSEMDLSLAFPLYFAARGAGELVDADAGRTPYTVQSKVYISGLGADEQLGGYGRHRKAYERGGHDALVEELDLDIARLPTRNLSRDDRVLSSTARDARYPYLDLDFVAYLSALPVAAKCDFTLPPGEGDKRLLRKATALLGLAQTAVRVKRAMQFGTRSAKLGTGVRKGESASRVAITEADL
ncbi:hypothetical protein Q5752_006412 [Cryptotrichosporon argae]